MESFWNQVKCVSRKYNAIPKESFPLFFKECGLGFSHGIPKQLKILKSGLEFSAYQLQEIFCIKVLTFP